MVGCVIFYGAAVWSLRCFMVVLLALSLSYLQEVLCWQKIRLPTVLIPK